MILEKDEIVISRAPEGLEELLTELRKIPVKDRLAKDAARDVAEIGGRIIEEKSDIEIWQTMKLLGDWILSEDILNASDELRAFSIMIFCGINATLADRWQEKR